MPNYYDISVSSFSDFTDKEYASKILTTGNCIKCDSSSSLSPEQIQNIDHLVRLEYVLPHYARIANWHKIHNLLPPLDLPINWLTITLMIVFFFSPIVMPIICIILYFKWKKRTVMPEVKRLALETGGWATDNVRRENCKIIIAGEEKAIQLLKFPLANSVDTYLAKNKQVKEQISGLIDQLELSAK